MKKLPRVVPRKPSVAKSPQPVTTVNENASIAAEHPARVDNRAVDNFAYAMRIKLAVKRQEGRGGWQDKEKCSNEYLSQLLREHVEKGDPVDVANFAMMIHQRHESIAPSPAPRLLGFQERVAAAHHALFHDDPTDIEERRARFAEEVNETLQAFGMSREDMHRLVDYSWDRPVGEPAKEIGAALLTLTSLCVIAGYDLMSCGEADLEKLQRPETIARIRDKRATRHGRGPLPGIDPGAPASEGSADGN